MQPDQRQPRIRGDNPPVSNLHLAESHNRKITESKESMIGCLAACVVLAVGVKLLNSAYLGLELFLFAATAVLAYLHYSSKISVSRNAISALTSPIHLHTYNREFTAPLADNSTVTTNIFFTLPAAQESMSDQLDRVTEKEFLIFVAPQLTPPTAREIQDHLQKSLLRFQDEYQVLLIRLEVSLNVHKPALKPKGGASVSV